MIKINESDQSGWKYEVYTDYVTIHTDKSTINRYGYSEQDIIDEYQRQRDTDPQSEGIFDSKEEAIAHAKTLNAVTYERQAYGKGINLECHIVYVEEVEYDEDGEFLNGGSWVYFDCEEVGNEERTIYEIWEEDAEIVDGETNVWSKAAENVHSEEFVSWQIDDSPEEEEIVEAFSDYVHEQYSDFASEDDVADIWWEKEFYVDSSIDDECIIKIERDTGKIDQVTLYLHEKPYKW